MEQTSYLRESPREKSTAIQFVPADLLLYAIVVVALAVVPLT